MFSALTLPGCIIIDPFGPAYNGRGHAKGPPAHAPAFGLRKKQIQGYDLRLDERLGVFIVLGLTNTYFLDDNFFEFRDGRWFVAKNVKGPWKKAKKGRIPVALFDFHRGKDRGKKLKKNKF